MDSTAGFDLEKLHRKPVRIFSAAALPPVLCVLGKRGQVVAQALEAGGILVSPDGLARRPRTRWTAVTDLSRHGLLKLARQRWSLVLTDSVETTPLAYALARWQCRPLVVRVRGDAWAEIGQSGDRGLALRAPGIRSLVRLYGHLLRQATLVVPVSTYLGQQLSRQADVSPARIEPVPVSVAGPTPSELTREEARERLGWGAEPVILSITNFRFPAKVAGLSALFPAMRQLLEAHPTLRWVVTGGGPGLDTFRQRARVALGPVAPRFEAPGYIGAMPVYYAASDLVAYFTGLDAFPRAVLEAQGAGRVVLANPVGGVPEIIQHGVSGYLVEPGPSFHDLTIELLNDPDRRAEIGATAQATVARDFSPERVGARWREILTRLAGESRTA